MKLVYFAPHSVQIPRADPQCIVYACEALQRIGVEVELVAMEFRTIRGELRSKNPLELYRLPIEPRLRMVKCLARDNSSLFWDAANRFLVHAYVALQHRNEAAGGQLLVFYTKDYSSAWLFEKMRRALMPSLKVIFEAHTLPHRRYQLAVLRGADGIVANSLALADDLHSLLPHMPMLGTHQGVDLDHYNSLRVSKEEARRKVNLPIESRNVVYTGKIIWRYREVELLLESAEHLAPGIELTLVGGRVDVAEKYRDYVQQRGLRNVRVIGEVPPREVQWYQLAADALVSYYPAGLKHIRYLSPTKLFEYMAAGRPIVAGDYACLREVVDDSAAILVEPENPKKLAVALNQLLLDEARMATLGRAALKRVEQFTWLERAQKIVSFAQSLP